jgi:hypothetical protein
LEELAKAISKAAETKSLEERLRELVIQTLKELELQKETYREISQRILGRELPPLVKEDMEKRAERIMGRLRNLLGIPPPERLDALFVLSSLQELLAKSAKRNPRIELLLEEILRGLKDASKRGPFTRAYKGLKKVELLLDEVLVTLKRATLMEFIPPYRGSRKVRLLLKDMEGTLRDATTKEFIPPYLGSLQVIHLLKKMEGLLRTAVRKEFIPPYIGKREVILLLKQMEKLLERASRRKIIYRGSKRVIQLLEKMEEVLKETLKMVKRREFLLYQERWAEIIKRIRRILGLEK